MSTHPVRASDAERDEVAHVIQTAGGDGRLSLAETEERLTGVYAARFRHELTAYTADLPAAPARAARAWPARPRGPLAVHAAIVVVLATLLIVRWLASGVPYFWPGFPLFWLAVSLVVHARIRRGRWPGAAPARAVRIRRLAADVPESAPCSRGTSSFFTGTGLRLPWLRRHDRPQRSPGVLGPGASLAPGSETPRTIEDHDDHIC